MLVFHFFCFFPSGLLAPQSLVSWITRWAENWHLYISCIQITKCDWLTTVKHTQFITIDPRHKTVKWFDCFDCALFRSFSILITLTKTSDTKKWCVFFVVVLLNNWRLYICFVFICFVCSHKSQSLASQCIRGEFDLFYFLFLLLCIVVISFALTTDACRCQWCRVVQNNQYCPYSCRWLCQLYDPFVPYGFFQFQLLANASL